MSAAFDEALARHRGGRPDLALPVYRRLLAEDPGNAELHHLLAVACLQTGAVALAEASAREAVRLAPDHAKAWNTLGNVLAALKRPLEAEAAFAQAGRADPRWAEARLNRGQVLAGLGRTDEALECFAEAARLVPADPRPLVNQGALLIRQKRSLEAEASLRRALELAPGQAEALNNLGQALLDLRRPGEALAVLDQAVAVAPAMASLHANRANAQEALGAMEESLASFRQAIALDPANPTPHHNLLVSVPFMDSLTAAQVFEEFKAFGRTRSPKPVGPFLVGRESQRDLRIGLLSPSLCQHVLRQNIAPVLREFPRDRAKICVFAHVPRPDAVTRAMQGWADEWCFVQAMDDEAVAQRILEDRIDVLVHPMGHWSDNRILAAARKPAPILVSYLCNSPTSGLNAFDATLIDRWLDYDGSIASLCVETPLRLDSGFQVTEYDAAPPIGPPPCRANGFVTFASFNNPAKLSDASLDLWAAVLARVPGSRLMLKGGGLDDPELAVRVTARLEGRGIASGRLDLVGRVPGYEEHLGLYNRADIQLDTIPFTGGRTTEDALWMGVPVVTLVGEGVYGRFSFGHLSRIGHAELAAFTPADYVAKAVALACDADRLDQYRLTLRPAMLASSIMDFVGHARDLDATFRALWSGWCDRA